MATKKNVKNRGIALIKKSNQLIEARYKFDVWETRFFLALLGKIHRDDENFIPYRIWYKDLINTFGLKSNQSYDLLRVAARSLMQKTFKVSNISENGIRREKEYHIVRTVDYMAEGEENKSNANQEEYIDVTFEPEMRPLLLQLQRNFTAYDLQNVVKLGTYPVRIYELLKQYETIGQRTLQFEEMKRMFELESEYPLFANFFQRIIKPSVRDINEFTDLKISHVEKLKHGKKVSALRFVFAPKNEPEARQARGAEQPKAPNYTIEIGPAKSANAVPADEKDRLMKLFFDEVVHKIGVTPSVFLNLVENYDEGQINQALRVTRRAKAAGQIKSNPAGFFVQAMKAGYTDPKEEENRRKMTETAQKEQEETLKRRLAELEDERGAAINERIRKLTAENPDATETAIESLRQNPLLEPVIEKNRETLGRELTVEDFRQDKMLREMTKRAIVEQNRAVFEDIFAEFDQLKLELTK